MAYRAKPTRGKTGKRLPKRVKSAYVRGVGYTPVDTIFPASARGKYRTGGNYGRHEMKFIDNVLASSAMAITGSLRPNTSDTTTGGVIATTGTLNQVVQGDQTFQRNGKQIMIKKIHGRLQVIFPSQTVVANSSSNYRIMLILDQQANGAAPAASDILGYPNGTVAQPVSSVAFNNLENSERFRVLLDVNRPMNQMFYATTATGIVQHFIKFNKRCNIPIIYSASTTTGALATIKTNNLLLLTASDTGLVQLTGVIRIRYTDN